MWRGTVGAGMPVGEGRRGDPGLEGRLVAPAGDDEPGRAAVRWAEQLEPLEAVGVVHGSRSSGETPRQLVTRALRDRDGIDAHNAHPFMMTETERH